MSNNYENQSQLNNKTTNNSDNLEDLINFHFALKELTLIFEGLFPQILLPKDSAQSTELKKQLSINTEEMLWHLYGAQKFLPLIISLAKLGKSQFIEYNGIIVKVTNVTE